MIIESYEIFFDEVTGTDDQIMKLYALLKERVYSISHHKLPSYDQHIYFVKNNPYKIWYIVYNNNEELGSFYLKNDNSIGLNLKKNEKKIVMEILNFINMNLKPNLEIPSDIPPYFYLNISPTNTELIRIFESLGKQPIQVSYKTKWWNLIDEW